MTQSPAIRTNFTRRHCGRFLIGAPIRRVLIAGVVSLLAILISACGNLYTDLVDLERAEVDLLVSSFDTAGPGVELLAPDGLRREGFSLEVTGFLRTAEQLSKETVFIGGDFTSVNGTPVTGAATVDRNTGELLPDYRLELLLGGANPGYILGSVELNDGSMIIVGNWESIDGFTETPDVARIFPDGSVDTSFGFGAFDGNGTFPNQEVRSVGYAGGRVYVSGFFDQIGTRSGARIEADKFFSFRPGDSVAEINPPLVPDGPTDVADTFVPGPEGSMIALGNFSVTFEENGSLFTLRNGVVLRGEEPTSELRMDLPNATADFWSGEWIPGLGLLITGPFLAGGHAVEPWLVWYDESFIPTFDMPLSIDGVGIPFYLAQDEIYVHGNYSSAVDWTGAAGPGSMLKMNSGFEIDTDYQPEVASGATVVALFPLF